jgi:hypothetical protein
LSRAINSALPADDSKFYTDFISIPEVNKTFIVLVTKYIYRSVMISKSKRLITN